MASSTRRDAVDPGATLRDARTARGLSLRAVAARTHVSAAALSQLETGKASLSPERLALVATFLGVDLGLPAPQAPAGDPGFTSWREFEPASLPPVLQAALEAFVATGFHGSPIREIAERAGMSVAGIYHHYPSKQALLQALMDTGMRELIARSEAARDEGRDPVERTRLLVEAIVLYHLHRQQQAFLGVAELRALTPANRELQVELRDWQQRLVDVEVAAAVEAGLVDLPDPISASRALVTMCTAVASWYRPGGPLSPADVARQYVDYALRLLGPPLAPAP